MVVVGSEVDEHSDRKQGIQQQLQANSSLQGIFFYGIAIQRFFLRKLFLYACKSLNILLQTSTEETMIKYYVISMMMACVYAIPQSSPITSSALTEGVWVSGHHADRCDPCTSFTTAWSVRYGFYGDYVYATKLTAETLSLWTNAATIVCNLYDRFELFAVYGATQFYLKQRHSTIDAKAQPYCAVGYRAVIADVGCFTWNVQGAYACTHIMLDQRIQYQQLYLTTAISQRIDTWAPYVGMYYMYTKKNEAILQHRYIGYSVGISMLKAQRAMISVEARFRAQKALHLALDLRI